MEVKKCAKCGAEIPEGAEYCEKCKCQEEVSQEQNETEELENSEKLNSLSVEQQEEHTNEIPKDETGENVVENDEASECINEEIKKKKSAKVKIGIAVVAGIIILIGGIGYFNSDMYTYSRAIKLYENKEYNKASEKFNEIPEYKDSKTYLQKCYIEYGDALYDTGKYEEAINSYSQVQTDDDLSETAYKGAKKSAYQLAKELKENGSYESALRWLEYYGWNNEDELVQECKYNIGKQYYDNGNYDEALKYVQYIDYEDSQKVTDACKYNIGKQYYDNGDYDNAINYLQDIDYEDSRDIVNSLLNNPMSLDKFVERYNNIIDALSGEVQYLSSYRLDASKMNDNKIERDAGASTMYYKFNAVSGKDCKYEVDYVQLYIKGWILYDSDLLAALQFALFGAYSPNTTAD